MVYVAIPSINRGQKVCRIKVLSQYVGISRKSLPWTQNCTLVTILTFATKLCVHVCSTLMSGVEHSTAVLPCHLKEKKSCDVEASYGHCTRSFKLVKVTAVAWNLFKSMPTNASRSVDGERGRVVRERERERERERAHRCGPICLLMMTSLHPHFSAVIMNSL